VNRNLWIGCGNYILILLSITLFVICGSSLIYAYPSYFTSQCSSCHNNDVQTCNGCHHHGSSGLSASLNKTAFTPGEQMLVTLSGGSLSGWVRGLVYDNGGLVIDEKTGPNYQGPDGGIAVEFPINFRVKAPLVTGAFSYSASYFGYSSGHKEIKKTMSFTVQGALPAILVTIDPLQFPLYLSASGGSIGLEVTLENTTSQAKSFEVWLDATLPTGQQYGPVYGPVTAALPGNYSVTKTATLKAPGSAPKGFYFINVYVGKYATKEIWNTDSFWFGKN
jgi:hypothetical protein